MPRAHPPELRHRAVELAWLRDKPVAQIAEDLGFSDSCLRNWMKQADVDEGRRADGLTTAERDELVKLCRELRVASVAGTVVNTVVIAKVGAAGQVTIYNRFGTVDLVVDVVGYYAPDTGDGYNPLTSFRLLDSRDEPADNIGPFATPWGPNTERLVTVTGGAVPTNASAVVLNITTVDPTAWSYLTVYPTGTARPTTAASNFVAGTVVNTVVIAKVGAAGQVTIYNRFGTVDLVVDVVGYTSP